MSCLRALLREGHEIAAVLAQAGPTPPGSVAAVGRELGLRVLQYPDVNDAAALSELRALNPELVVLAGFNQIVKKVFIELAPRGCINLHGGRLPEYRGSSPMNWALIRGEREFGLSIIQVDGGVDTGDVLVERSFPIGADDSFAEISKIANEAFPEMLLEATRAIQNGGPPRRKQDERKAGYFPLRFPDDGLVLWDQLDAAGAHDMIRGLAEPAPGAFTYWEGRRMLLLGSRREPKAVHGEPGRVYRAGPSGLLVCARDRCLWVTKARFLDGSDALAAVPRYARLATVREAAMKALEGAGGGR